MPGVNQVVHVHVNRKTLVNPYRNRLHQGQVVQDHPISFRRCLHSVHLCRLKMQCLDQSATPVSPLLSVDFAPAECHSGKRMFRIEISRPE